MKLFDYCKLFLVVSAFFTVCVSCGSDDEDSSEVINQSVVGTWRLITCSCWDESLTRGFCSKGEELCFYSDGTGYYDDGYNDLYTIKWSLRGKTLNINVQGLYVAEYEVSFKEGDRLVLWEDNDSFDEGHIAYYRRVK